MLLKFEELPRFIWSHYTRADRTCQNLTFNHFIWCHYVGIPPQSKS
jgi:hypothetical protein